MSGNATFKWWKADEEPGILIFFYYNLDEVSKYDIH